MVLLKEVDTTMLEGQKSGKAVSVRVPEAASRR